MPSKREKNSNVIANMSKKAERSIKTYFSIDISGEKDPITRNNDVHLNKDKAICKISKNLDSKSSGSLKVCQKELKMQIIAYTTSMYTLAETVDG